MPKDDSNKIKNMYFFQFNFNYGNDIFIPYSIGIIWSYAKSFKEISSSYVNKGFIFVREDPDKIVTSLDKPDVCAFSCYLWNWEINVEVAKRIKKIYPECLIVFGGPQVPNEMEGFFKKYDFIDITVHGEGEITFAEILKANLKNNKEKEYDKIQGISFNKRDGKFKRFECRELIKDLDTIPSPYLTGVFDDILKSSYNFQPIWETNRGCPYSCKYCDWGTSAITKIRAFDTKRLEKEIEWFGEKKISFIFGADANFGIMQRDVELAEKLAEKKKESGYPEKFRVSYAKLSSDRVFEIAKILNKEKMDKGISLSVQSMDKMTLNTIMRTNLQFDSLSKFIVDYQKANIPTFTELILALPGETYESFKQGIDKLFDAGVHNSLIIYDCTILPNAPMNDDEYKKEHHIKITRLPIFLNHSIPGQDYVQEYENIITSTKTMPEKDYRKTNIFSWIIQTSHTLNLTQFIAIYLKDIYNIEYSDLYEELINFARENPDTVIGKELIFVNKKIDDTLQGKSKDIVLKEFSDVTWAMDEASYLRISKNLDMFFSELKMFMAVIKNKFSMDIDEKVIDEIVSYQEAIIVKWAEPGDKEIIVSYPYHHFYKAKLINQKYELKKSKYKIKIKDNLRYCGDKKRYSKEVIWWGRKGGKFIYQDVEEEEI